MIPQRSLIFVVILSSLPAFKVFGEDFVSHIFRDSVGAGNYSYYRLSLDGDIDLVLKTIEGDCDIYVSDKTLHPTYALEKHSLQSTTCGVDHVLIPSKFRRPVGIGIYGHPSHAISYYELEVIQNTKPDRDYFAPEGTDYSDFDRTEHPRIPSVMKDDEESLLWSIFIGLLRLLLEILT